MYEKRFIKGGRQEDRRVQGPRAVRHLLREEEQARRLRVRWGRRQREDLTLLRERSLAGVADPPQ